jgi:hypothetical protein
MSGYPNIAVKPRRLKVYYGHNSGTYRRIPVIRLGGKYLTSQNFNIGDMLDVTIQAGEIHITKIQPDIKDNA